MEQAITHYLSATVQGYSILAVLLVFMGGIITSIGPCNLSMIPLLMAYVGGTAQKGRLHSFRLSLFFTLGTSTTFALLGVIVSLIGGIFGASKQVLIYIAAAVSLAVGLKMLGILSFSLPDFGTRIVRRPTRQGLGAAYVMGLMIGLAGSQCGTPVLFAILSLVMSKGRIAYGAILLFVYGLGRGIPVMIAGTFTGYAKGLPGMAHWSQAFERVAGFVLILISIYLIWVA